MSEGIEARRVVRRNTSERERQQELERQRQLAEKMFGRQEAEPASGPADPYFGDGGTSDNFTGGRGFRRSNSDTDYQHELELDRQRVEKELERQLARNAAAQVRTSKRQPSAVESALRVLGVLSVIGGLLGGMLAAGDIEIVSMLVASGVVSAVSLFWMAQVLGTLLEIRDRLDR